MLYSHLSEISNPNRYKFLKITYDDVNGVSERFMFKNHIIAYTDNVMESKLLTLFETFMNKINNDDFNTWDTDGVQISKF